MLECKSRLLNSSLQVFIWCTSGAFFTDLRLVGERDVRHVYLVKGCMKGCAESVAPGFLTHSMMGLQAW